MTTEANRAAQAQIEALMAQFMAASKYTPPASFTGYQAHYTPVNRSLPIGNAPVALRPEDFYTKDKKKKKSKISIGDVLSGTIGQTSGIVNDWVYNSAKSWKEVGSKKNDTGLAKELFNALIGNSIGSTITRGVTAGAKKQVKNWTDDKWSWGDVPLVGVLNGMDKHWKRGDDIMGDVLGVENKWGKMLGGLALDIALDPLTYMTLGASTAGKAGKTAEVAEIVNQANKAGMTTTKFKNADDFAKAAKQLITKEVTGKLKVAHEASLAKVESMTRAKYAKYPNLVDDAVKKAVGKQKEALDSLVQRRVTKQVDDMMNSIKGAKAEAFNKHINSVGFSAPFSNKVAVTGNYGEKMLGLVKNPIYRSEAKVGSSLVDDLLHKASLGDNAMKDIFNRVTKARYGVDDIANLTKTQFDDLHGFLKPLIDKMDNGKNAKPMLDARNMTKTVDKMLDTKYDKLNNAKTTFEHTLDKINPFDSRTLQTGNKFVDSMADHISDANSQRIGETAMYTKDLNKLQKLIKKGGYTPDEMKEAIYAIEKNAPKSYGKNWKPSTRVEKLANTIKPIIQKMSDSEVEGGVLNSLRKNYFPHVVNKTDDDMKDLMDFVARNPLNGKKATSGFDQKRKSFQTIADRDNYLKNLEKAIQKETDPATIESLRRKQDQIAEMFDTNVVSALHRRIKEGVRAKAMKAMQGELSKFGMMKTIKKGSGEAPPSGLMKLDPADARKLGLDEGTHYMHEKVFEGLKRVDEVFTDQGMNKMARHISAIGDIWRPLVTYYKPAHYLNNMIGNTINNMAAGVKPTDVVKATKLLKRYRSGKLSDDEMKIIKSAYKHNVISGGFLFDSRPNFEFDSPTKIEEFAKLIGDNKAIRRIRKAGEVIDDVSRMANFLHGMEKYGDSAKAAKQVREYLFNYNELTNADRHMRVLVPFWNWTKRNIPLQMKLLMENPKVPVNVERFKDYWNENEKGEDWQKETGLHLPFTMETKDKKGKVRDTEFYTSLPSPTNDLNMLLHPSEFLGSMTPAVKVPLELSMNRKMYTGKPISYGSDNVQSEDMLEYLMSNLGVGNNAYQTIAGDKSAFENIMGMLRPVTRVNPNQ